jgi:iron uptake system component EfeO
MLRRLSVPLAVGVLALVACTTSSGDGIAVTATDDSCEVATTELDAGRTTFSAKNEGSDVTEVYVYAPGDRVMGEVENIGPGTSRDLTVDLTAGTYEVACKPGMKGDGIRTEITVTGAGGAEVGAANKTVQVDAVDYEFEGIADKSFESGQVVEFLLYNAAPEEEHEFEVFDPKGNVLGEVGPTKPEKTGGVVLELHAPGRYRVVCGIDDHEEKGMVSSFTVH